MVLAAVYIMDYLISTLKPIDPLGDGLGYRIILSKIAFLLGPLIS